jgi:hypothetical protein
MLQFKQTTRIRDAIQQRASDRSLSASDRRSVRKLAAGGRAFDKWLDNKRTTFARKNPHLKGEAADAAFVDWIVDFITSGKLKTLVTEIMSILAMFTKK